MSKYRYEHKFGLNLSSCEPEDKIMKNLISCLVVGVVINLITTFATSDVIEAKSVLPPRKDLYQRIIDQTGISLRQVFDVVFKKTGKNEPILKKLSQLFKNKRGLKRIEADLRKDIKALNKHCEQEKHDCQQQVNNLNNELNALKKYEPNNKKSQLYKYLLVFNHTVRYEVLQSSYLIWQKKCQKTINSTKCKSQFFEIDILYEIVNQLTQSAYLLLNSENNTHSPRTNQKNKIDRLIQRYEQS